MRGSRLVEGCSTCTLIGSIHSLGGAVISHYALFARLVKVIYIVGVSARRQARGDVGSCKVTSRAPFLVRFIGEGNGLIQIKQIQFVRSPNVGNGRGSLLVGLGTGGPVVGS